MPLKRSEIGFLLLQTAFQFFTRVGDLSLNSPSFSLATSAHIIGMVTAFTFADVFIEMYPYSMLNFGMIAETSCSVVL